MPKKRVLLLLIIIFVFGWSCKKTNDLPQVDFSYTANVLTATFTSTSPGATVYNWDFGDNEGSQDQNPVHLYAYGGLYNVKLTISSPNGSNTVEKQVRIKTPTSVKITGFKVLSYNSFVAWDSTDGPDIYWQFDGDTVIKSTVINNVSPTDLPLTWTISPAIVINDFDTRYSFYVFDDDTPQADRGMGGYYFPFSIFTVQGHPTKGLVGRDGNPYLFELTLEWE